MSSIALPNPTLADDPGLAHERSPLPPLRLLPLYPLRRKTYRQNH